MNFLACDLGGTKVLLGIFERVTNDDSPKLLFKKKYLSSDWDSFELILEDFLKNECKNITHPSSACFAVAGPLSNNNAKIMNLSWNISGNKLKNKFKFEQCELINDFAVQIYGIPFLKKINIQLYKMDPILKVLIMICMPLLERGLAWGLREE